MQTSTGGPVRFFAEPLAEGWVYPCSIDDLRKAVEQAPAEDVKGLHSVGLAASTRKDCNANARYFATPVPRILVYSYPADLCIYLDRKTTLEEARRFYAAELESGMCLGAGDGRVVCRWSPEALRGFVCGHVMPHEIGHHVYRYHMGKSATWKAADLRESEKFAEHYALRFRRRESNGGAFS